MIVSSVQRHVPDVQQLAGNSWLITFDDEEIRESLLAKMSLGEGH